MADEDFGRILSEINSYTGWQKDFVQEFGIHFQGSEGELGFALAFIEGLINKKFNVSRLEVIDWRDNSKTQGRILVTYRQNMTVETSLQDDDRTLKIFIKDNNSK